MQAGKSSIQFEHPPIITSAASIVGQTEGEGPLASFFDRVEPDPTFDGSRGWLCGPGSGAGVEPFCLGRTAVPVSAGVWESETAVHNLDGDRVRVCDDRGK